MYIFRKELLRAEKRSKHSAANFTHHNRIKIPSAIVLKNPFPTWHHYATIIQVPTQTIHAIAKHQHEPLRRINNPAEKSDEQLTSKSPDPPRHSSRPVINIHTMSKNKCKGWESNRSRARLKRQRKGEWKNARSRWLDTLTTRCRKCWGLCSGR